MTLKSEELPKPTYDNSVVISWTYEFIKSSEAGEAVYLKKEFGHGLYTILSFSTFVAVDMPWNTDIDHIGSGIDAYRAYIDRLVAFARKYKVGLHVTLTYGIARNVNFYAAAKREDIRNAQWYNDNNLRLPSQKESDSLSFEEEENESGFPDLNFAEAETKPDLSALSAEDTTINSFVFTTLSRYARKVRAHLEAKVKATYWYLKQVQNANPDILIVVSAPGEAELSYFRINHSTPLQQYFCDYSPFAVLEFRDWIKHEGLYADGGKYAGEGYAAGGARYSGSTGLANFNADFGTAFTSWNLKYFNWSLSDPVDTDYTDDKNPDTRAVLVSQYTYGKMMPSAGSKYIPGGFDPPRTMVKPGTNAFYDLWHLFREELVAHYVKDMAKIARQSGFPKNRCFTHQIPADHLFNTQPNNDLIPFLNPRYYSSASPLRTAYTYPDMGTGITLYDINFGTWYARTTLFGIAAVDALSDNWAALEYNPDVIPPGVTASISPITILYNQIMRIYDAGVHVIGVYRWKDHEENTHVYRFKGNNREVAAKQFFNDIKDVARKAITTVFTPKRVEGFAGVYNSSTGYVNLTWSKKIWPDLDHEWADWGHFKEYVIFRGISPDFVPSDSNRIARKSASSYAFIDSGVIPGTANYYKIAAVNSASQIGPFETIPVAVPPDSQQPVLAVSTTRLNFGYITGGTNPPSQQFRVFNEGIGSLNWKIEENTSWLSCTPSSGQGNGKANVLVDPASLAVGSYDGVVTISDSTALDSPQSVHVYLAVKDAGDNQAPFGSFDTPTDNSTVSGSIALTGWALDDVGVQAVKIYRSPLAEEGESPVYIGTATFVDGARPDIEAAYPNYPLNQRAGWGYMLLSNYLPGKGNGTFKLVAQAVDPSGTEFALGEKTIVCNNAEAVKPFGTLDTPEPGASVSGTKYVVWGWALTPMPNEIPADGSTIWVYIDGEKKGHPVYNISRSDIAGIFPGYANSDGAVGYFTLDTTQYADGVHTIAWMVKDNAGNEAGIGSRFFTISNHSATSSRPGTLNLSAITDGHPFCKPSRLDGFPTLPKTFIKVKKILTKSTRGK